MDQYNRQAEVDPALRSQSHHIPLIKVTIIAIAIPQSSPTTTRPRTVRLLGTSCASKAIKRSARIVPTIPLKQASINMYIIYPSKLLAP
jgi:hypothetical protein